MFQEKSALILFRRQVGDFKHQIFMHTVEVLAASEDVRAG